MITTRVAHVATLVFTVSAAAAAIADTDALDAVAVAVDLLLFGAGCVAFVWSYAIAVRRSRTDEIAVTNLYLLAGEVAPPAVKRQLRMVLAVQVAVALGTAAIRPFSALAFGVLVPVFGLGVTGLWAARHGTFPPRQSPARPGRARRTPEAGGEP